jgi:hypothetical protein
MARPLPDNKTDFAALDNLIAAQQSKNPDGTHLYQWWQIWNAAYFENTLSPIVVSYQNTDYGRNLGFCQYDPIKQIVIQKRTVLPARADNNIMRHRDFTLLTPGQYCLALVLLHEMMHQACFEAKQDPGHNGQPWADHCNFIGKDLKLGVTYSPMKRQKQNIIDSDGNIVRRNGKPVRENVWRPTGTLLKNTKRFATYKECLYFPWLSDAAFIEANTLLDHKNQKLTPRF